MSRVRVVLIDDEPALCRVFRLILQRRAGAEVQAFTRPLEALAYLRDAAVDVVLCDFRMPSMTGEELREELDRDLPFYIVTGELAVVARLRAMPGVMGVLEKPMPPERLVEIVRRHAPPAGTGPGD